MNATKPWYLSRTIWASLVTVLTGAAGFFGLPAGEIDGAELTEAILQAVTAVAGLIAILGRVAANSRIG